MLSIGVLVAIRKSSSPIFNGKTMPSHHLSDNIGNVSGVTICFEYFTSNWKGLPFRIDIDAVDGFHYISSRNIHSSHARLWILLENFSLLQCSLTINSNDISTLHRAKLFCVPWCHLEQSCNFVARSNVRFSVFNTFYRIYMSIKPQTN